MPEHGFATAEGWRIFPNGGGRWGWDAWNGPTALHGEEPSRIAAYEAARAAHTRLRRQARRLSGVPA